jgi:TATA-box binding protein (TBP) (component of TFIID and TFIIIB)
MKLKNLKVQFKIEKKIHFETSRHIFLVDSATCTVYSHSKNILHITGIKSFFHLDQIKMRINRMFHLVSYKIDNQFYSHKDNKILNLDDIYFLMRQQQDGFKVSYEPELFNGIIIRHQNKSYPTALLFKTGSYQIMGGKMCNVCYVNKFVKMYLK